MDIPSDLKIGISTMSKSLSGPAMRAALRASPREERIGGNGSIVGWLLRNFTLRVTFLGRGSFFWMELPNNLS